VLNLSIVPYSQLSLNATCNMFLAGDRPISLNLNLYRHFQKNLASFRYSIGFRYRYSKLCLPIYL